MTASRYVRLLGLTLPSLVVWSFVVIAVAVRDSFPASAGDCWRFRDSCRMATQNSDHRRTLSMAERLREEAEREGSDWFMAYALYYQGVSNVILGNSGLGKAQLDEAYRYADAVADDTLRLSIHNGYGVYEANTHANYASAQRHFYEALEYAVKIGDPLRQALIEANLAETASIRRDTSGLRYALSCYEWGMTNDNAQLGFAGAYHCANLLHIAGDHEKAMAYIRKADELAASVNYVERSATYNLRGSICAALGRDIEALEWMEKAVAGAGEAQGATLPEIYCTYARILADQGRLAESDRMIARGFNVSDSLLIRSSLAPLLAQRARNYERRGDYRRALEAYKAYKESCDSANVDRQLRSINELRVQYDIERREQEANMHALMLRGEQRKTAILWVSLLSVTAILFILWHNYRRQKRLYRNIVMAHRDAVAREQELLGRIGSRNDNISDKPVPRVTTDGEISLSDIPDAYPANQKTRTNLVFDSLCRLMEVDEVYRDGNLTRERLAEMLGTNRTYLSQIIAEHTGKGYYQFVNGYRIKEAVRILSGPEGTAYPLKAIAADLGFKSMTTFYKTFQEVIGMTPSAYRDTASTL